MSCQPSPVLTSPVETELQGSQAIGDGGLQAVLPLQQGAPKEMEVNGEAGKFSGENSGGRPQQAQAWSRASHPGVAGSVTHEGMAVILLTLTLELLLKDGDCSGRFIENGPDFPRRPRLTTVPKVS